MRSISADALRLAVRLADSSDEKPGILARVHVTDAPLSYVEGPLKEEERLLKSMTPTGVHDWHPFSKVWWVVVPSMLQTLLLFVEIEIFPSSCFGRRVHFSVFCLTPT